MGLYSVISGEQYFVKANSREEAEAKYYVSLGYESAEAYPDFDFSTLDEDVEEGEVTTDIDPILDLS